MVGEAHHGVGVSGGPVVHGEAALFEGIGDADLQLPRKALLPVGGGAAEGDGVLSRGKAPEPAVKALRTAVEEVFPLVGSQAVLFAVQFKPGAADAVGVPADAVAQMGVARQVLPGGLIAQHHVGGAALPVRHPHRPDGGAQAQKFRGAPSLIGEGHQVDAAAGQGLKGTHADHFSHPS